MTIRVHVEPGHEPLATYVGPLSTVVALSSLRDALLREREAAQAFRAARSAPVLLAGFAAWDEAQEEAWRALAKAQVDVVRAQNELAVRLGGESALETGSDVDDRARAIRDGVR